jgi:hypothetical protein
MTTVNFVTFTYRPGRAGTNAKIADNENEPPAGEAFQRIRLRTPYRTNGEPSQEKYLVFGSKGGQTGILMVQRALEGRDLP